MDVNNHIESPIPQPEEKRRQKYLHFKLRSEDQALMALLPQMQRELLTAEGSYRDIASRFGVPIGTVRSRLHRARVALEKLRHDNGEETPANKPSHQ